MQRRASNRPSTRASSTAVAPYTVPRGGRSTRAQGRNGHSQRRGGSQVSTSSRGRGEAPRRGRGRGTGSTCGRRGSSRRRPTHGEEEEEPTQTPEEESTQAPESESTTEPSVEEDSHLARDQLLRLIRAEVQAVTGIPPPVPTPTG